MAALRLDRNHRLVSDPFAMRFAQPGDQTGFRHLDQSPERLIQVVTANCYSAVVTFSAENKTNSSVMLEGIHRDFPDWCERLN